MSEQIQIEVAFAEPQLQRILSLEVPAGTTVAEAIELASIQHDYPEVRIDPALVGVWNRQRPLDHVLAAGDRVEIYRPLIADPKEVRRQRAAQAQVAQAKAAR